MSVEYLSTNFEKASYLQSLLVSYSTGGGGETEEYESIREELLSDPELFEILPKWIRIHRNLESFWGFIQPKLATYRERRAFLSEEFAPILNFLEFGEEPEIIEPPIQEEVAETVDQVVRPKSKVFIVHGRDNEAKQEVSRFIESLGIDVIILHEQASSGMTIIEKIEHYSNEADFAIVLYTACDTGKGSHEEDAPYRNRGRQNVVFEHGYLMAKVGRRNICALVKGEIETPNDISGVVYVPLDPTGGWRMEVVKELRACGYELKY